MALAQVNGTEIWYEIQGSGMPLMLFPGLGLDHQYYRLGEPLLRGHARTILLDPRGIGQSRKDSPSLVARRNFGPMILPCSRRMSVSSRLTFSALLLVAPWRWRSPKSTRNSRAL